MLPSAIDQELQSFWQKTIGRIKKDGFAKEFNGVVAKDAANELHVANRQMGTGGSAAQDRVLFDPNLVLVGIAHTHPTLNDADFSWGDVARMINDKDLIKLLQVGEEQFLLLRTGETSNAILSQSDMQDEQLKRINELIAKGSTRLQAVHISAREAAAKYRLAYYAGKKGVLTLIPFVTKHPAPSQSPRHK